MGFSPIRIASGVTDATTLVAVKGSFIAVHCELARHFCPEKHFLLKLWPVDDQ